MDPNLIGKFRYILYPGSVNSINDGDGHNINFFQLVQCYGLPRNLCEKDDNDPFYRGRRSKDYSSPLYIHLGVRIAGDYTEYLEKAIENRIKEHPGLFR